MNLEMAVGIVLIAMALNSIALLAGIKDALSEHRKELIKAQAEAVQNSIGR